MERNLIENLANENISEPLAYQLYSANDIRHRAEP